MLADKDASGRERGLAFGLSERRDKIVDCMRVFALVVLAVGSKQVGGKTTEQCKDHCCNSFFVKHPSTKAGEDASSCPIYSKQSNGNKGALLSCDNYRQALWRKQNFFTVHPMMGKLDVLGATDGETVRTVGVPVLEHTKSARYLCYCELACEKKTGILKELKHKVNAMKKKKRKQPREEASESKHYWGDKLKNVSPLVGVDDDESTTSKQADRPKYSKMPDRSRWFRDHVSKDKLTARQLYQMPPIADEGVIVAKDTGCIGTTERATEFIRVQFGDKVTIVAEGWTLPHMTTKAVANRISSDVMADLQFSLTYTVGRPNTLPRGLNEGVIGMCDGETRVLVVPGPLAHDSDVSKRLEGYEKFTPIRKHTPLVYRVTTSFTRASLDRP
jgi:hypothetical protein